MKTRKKEGKREKKREKARDFFFVAKEIMGFDTINLKNRKI